MAHRDDVEALQARLEAQERELRDAKAELDVLRAAVHRDAALKSEGFEGAGAPQAFRRQDLPPPGMGFSPGVGPRACGAQRRLGMLILVLTTLAAGLFLATAPCPSARYRRPTIRPPASVTAGAPDVAAWAPFVRFATVTDPGSPAAVPAETACAVELTPVLDNAHFDCRAIVRCGDRTLYGGDSRLGETGFNHCGPAPSLIVDDGFSAEDGDPRLRVDLASGEVILEEAVGLGVQRVELRLLPPE